MKKIVFVLLSITTLALQSGLVQQKIDPVTGQTVYYTTSSNFMGFKAAGPEAD